MTNITNKLLAEILSHIVWPICHARHRGLMSPYTFVARFWERVGGIGDTLDAIINRMLIRRGFDFDGYEF